MQVLVTTKLSRQVVTCSSKTAARFLMIPIIRAAREPVACSVFKVRQSGEHKRLQLPLLT